MLVSSQRPYIKFSLSDTISERLQQKKFYLKG